jgi:hypothetical protein
MYRRALRFRMKPSGTETVPISILCAAVCNYLQPRKTTAKLKAPLQNLSYDAAKDRGIQSQAQTRPASADSLQSDVSDAQHRNYSKKTLFETSHFALLFRILKERSAANL